MQELLEKLKSLDRDTWVRYNQLMNDVTPEHVTGIWFWQNATLRACLQDAISGKGWHWGFAVGTNAAIVSKDMKTFIRRSEDFPAKSLLAAYVAACEANL